MVALDEPHPGLGVPAGQEALCPEVSGERVVHMWTGEWRDGTYGRIAVPRALFHRLGGYDETLFPMGHQDHDLLLRARLAGADPLWVPGRALAVRALRNSKHESLALTGASWLGFSMMNRLNAAIATANRWRHGHAANPRGWGRGRVEVNFQTQVDL